MPTYISGKLKLKGLSNGDKKKKKKNKRTRDELEDVDGKDATASTTITTTKTEDALSDPDEFLTESQRKFEQKKRKAELAKAKEVVGTTYRDRVEKFNYDLSVMSEHNDIPRISAAGNG